MVDSSFKIKPSEIIETPQSAAEKKLRDVAKMYEGQFLREMVKAMRGTVTDSGFIKENQAEKIFREQLDQEYTDKWVDRGGLGFQDIIYNQLVEKYGPQLGIQKSNIEDQQKKNLPKESGYVDPGPKGQKLAIKG